MQAARVGIAMLVVVSTICTALPYISQQLNITDISVHNELTASPAAVDSKIASSERTDINLSSALPLIALELPSQCAGDLSSSGKDGADEPESSCSVGIATETLLQNHTAPVLELNRGISRRDSVLATESDLLDKCVCRGEKLTLACTTDKNKATEYAQPIDTPWDGTMEAELKLWGYRDEPSDSHCNFDDIETALKALKIGRKSGMEGGNNFCYKVLHPLEHGEARDQTYEVDGVKRRVSCPRLSFEQLTDC